jgi:DNA-binding transcriptional ArsR family regulator
MDLFGAIADPSRRAMLDILREGERPAGDIVEAFPQLTQSGVSRHLKVLLDAGLVEARASGQRRIYSLNAEKLSQVDAWIGQYREFWPTKLRALARHLDKRKDRGARPGGRP